MTDKVEAKPEAKPVAKTDDAPLPASQDGAAASTPQPDSATRLVLTLMGVTLVAGAALAGAHVITKDRIAVAKARKKLTSIKKVLPKCSNNPVTDAIKVGAKGKKTEVYRCRKNQPDGSSPVVAVAIGQSSDGNKNKPYSGVIRVMVGIDVKSGKIRSYKTKTGKSEVAVVIVKHSETPGLGSKAEDYDFRKAYVGRDLKGKDTTSGGKMWLTKKDNVQLGFVDAISGATVTSRAVTEIVKKALTVFNRNKTAIRTTVKGSPKPATGAKPVEPIEPAPTKEKQP